MDDSASTLHIHKNYTWLIADLNVKCEMKLRGDSRVDPTAGGVRKDFFRVHKRHSL